MRSQPDIRYDTQSVEHRFDPGRLQCRLGSRGGNGYEPRIDRDGWGRIDPYPRCALRALRYQGVVWAGSNLSGIPGRALSGASGWETLVHIGPISRTVADSALMLSVMAGPDDRDRHSLPGGDVDWMDCLAGDISGLKIAYSADWGTRRSILGCGKSSNGRRESSKTISGAQSKRPTPAGKTPTVPFGPCCAARPT